MAAVDGNGFKLEDDIGAKISGFRKEYDNDRDSREDFGRWNIFGIRLTIQMIYVCKCQFTNYRLQTMIPCC